jgi:dGTPase
MEKVSKENLPHTLEGQVVRWSDMIAYVNHDIDDAIRAGVITQCDLPRDCLEILGKTHRERINQMVKDVILNSVDNSSVTMSAPVRNATQKLRNFLFETVYFGEYQKVEREKAKRLIKELYQFFLENLKVLEKEYRINLYYQDVNLIVCDFISGMTDRYAMAIYRKYFIPFSWPQEGMGKEIN